MDVTAALKQLCFKKQVSGCNHNTIKRKKKFVLTKRSKFIEWPCGIAAAGLTYAVSKGVLDVTTVTLNLGDAAERALGVLAVELRSAVVDAGLTLINIWMEPHNKQNMIYMQTFQLEDALKTHPMNVFNMFLWCFSYCGGQTVM